MIIRAISGLFFVGLCLASLLYPDWYSYLVFGFFLAITFWESASFSSRAVGLFERLSITIVFSICIVLAFFYWTPKDNAMSFMLLLFLLAVFGNLLGRKSRPWLLCLYFAIPFFLLMVELRDLYEQKQVFMLFILIWGFDVFSYLGGRFFGETKPFPTLSPNKSLEGYAIGLVCLLGCTYLLEQPFWYTLIVAVLGSAGDLYISFLKRRVGLKDSGKIMPGHGGLIDRFDSFTLTYLAYFLIKYASKYYTY